MTRAATNRVIRFVNSKWFFAGTIIALIVQSVWIAINARYPLPFDESFHYGIIQTYARQWSPLLTSQPANNPGAYGELIHDPSYLYHYLMSFPYRILDFLFHSEVVNIGGLRFLNIALFALGLVGFRKLLLRFGASRTMTHAVLFIVMMVPVSSLLASQINYDNLLFCVMPLFVWLTFDVIDGINKRKSLTWKNLVYMLSAGFLISLVKYAFLPIFVVSVIYVIVVWAWNKRRKEAFQAVVTSFFKTGRDTKIGLAILFVLSAGLFLQRYGYNAIVYRAVQPDCAQVLTVNQCMQYGPWARNYRLDQAAKATHSNLVAPARNPLVFARGWSHAMVFRLYFSVDQDFNEYTPLPLPFVAAFVFGWIGIILAIVYIRRITRAYKYAWVCIVIILAYGFSLFLLNYQEYLRYGTVVAVNGRYLIPILPLLFVLIGAGYQQFIRDVGKSHQMTIKIVIVIIILVLTIDGGGFLGFLIHSGPKWFYPGDPFAGTSMWLGNVFSQIVLGGINEPVDHLINDLIR